MQNHKKILVSGASGGIGSELIKLIQFDKIKVVGSYNDKRPDFISGGDIVLEQVNFANLAQTRNFFSMHKDSTGLVLAAGLANPQLIGSINEDDILQVLNVNLTSNIIALNEILPTMVRSGFGRVILLGSIVARDGGVGLAAYSASKSALLGLVKTANREVRLMKERHNPQADVTINLLSPGYVATTMTKDIPLNILKKIQENSNSKKLIDVNEVASTLKWMLCATPSISNSNIEINDGLNLC